MLLLTMGGSKGQVIAGPDAKGRYSVKVCTDKVLGCVYGREGFKDTGIVLPNPSVICRTGLSGMMLPLHGGGLLSVLVCKSEDV